MINIIENINNWLIEIDKVSLITLILAIIIFLIPILKAINKILKAINNKFNDYKDKNFKRYHEIINEIQDGRFLGKQIVYVYELRHYKSYYIVTKRIMENFKETQKDNDKFKNSGLETEMNKTIEYIDKNNKWYRRIFI